MSAAKTQGNAAPYVVAIAVTAFVIFLAYIMFFMPKLKEAAVIRTNIETVAQEISILDAQLDAVGEHKENLGKLEESMTAFNTSFTLDPEQKRLFENITSAADAAGAKLVTVNPAVPELPEETAEVDEAGNAIEADAPVLAAVNIKIEAIGSTEDLTGFMRGIEALERPVSIASFEITKAGEDGFMLTANLRTWMADPLPAPTVGEDGTVTAPDYNEDVED